MSATGNVGVDDTPILRRSHSRQSRHSSTSLRERSATVGFSSPQQAHFIVPQFSPDVRRHEHHAQSRGLSRGTLVPMRPMKLTGIGLAVAVIAGLAVGSPAIAADSPAALQARKKAADSLVRDRTAALGRATDAISESHSMGPDQAMVISAFSNAASGLRQLD